MTQQNEPPYRMDPEAVRKQARLHAQWEWSMMPPQGCDIPLWREYVKAYNEEKNKISPTPAAKMAENVVDLMVQCMPISLEKADPASLLSTAEVIISALAKEESRPADTIRLDALAAESWDLRSFNMPTGGDDADIGWRVIGHYMAEPKERIMGEAFTDNPRAAIDDALLRSAPQGRVPCPPLNENHDEAMHWITNHCMALRRDNGDMDYSLGAMIAAYEAGKAAAACESPNVGESIASPPQGHQLFPAAPSGTQQENS